VDSRAINGCDAGSEFFNLTSVGMNVLASNVRDIALKSVLRAMENNAGFITVLNSTIFFAPKHPQFQRHVEPEQWGSAIDFGARDIVYAVTAVRNYTAELVKSIVGRIVGLERAARDKRGGAFVGPAILPIPRSIVRVLSRRAFEARSTMSGGPVH
jgi:hypothetical protein